MITAVDQPISMMPFGAVIGLSSRHCSGATIVDPAAEYYDDYYAVFFLDPDGMKLEGMRYGEKGEQAAKKRAAKKRTAAAKKKVPGRRDARSR